MDSIPDFDSVGEGSNPSGDTKKIKIMKLTTDENGEIILEDVFSGVGLKTRDGEFMGICMRDTGFEFNYQGTWYEAKGGIIRKLGEK